MANYIHTLQDKVRSQGRAMEQARREIREFRAHLCSPKFTSRPLDDHIQTGDVDARLLQLLATLVED